MDLNTIRRNLSKNVYKTLLEILNDIQLVWVNCQQYYKPDSVSFCNKIAENI
jgi:hypothetical protein